MEFTLHSLLFAATILWLSSVNGQVVVQPGYSIYDQQQSIQPYYYNPTQGQTVKIITSDPTLLQFLRGMDPQNLQDIVNKQLFPYLDDYTVSPNTAFNVQVGEGRNVGGFYPGPIIRPPVITNIRPSTVIHPGPFGPNLVKIGGVGTLGPSLLGREAESYEVGRPQTRSVESVCSSEPTCSGDDVSPRSSLKSPAKVVDLHHINVRAYDNNPGWSNQGNFQNTNDPDGKELTDQVLNAVQSELVHLLRNMNKDGSNPQNSNFSIDTGELRNILQKYTPASQYFSEMDGSYRNNNFNPSRPIDPFINNNYGNSDWNPRNGNLDSGNYNNWRPNPYGYPNNNGGNANNGFNYPPMNNGQFGNTNYNNQPMSQKLPVNPNYNNQPMNNNEQFISPSNNYQPINNNRPFSNPSNTYQPMNNQFTNPSNTYQPMNNNGQFTNPGNNYPAQNINGQLGNLNNFTPMNITGRPGIANFSMSNMSNNQQPGNYPNNLRPINNSVRPGSPNYNAPTMNSPRPGFSNPSIQPSMNAGRPDSTNQQNSPNSGNIFPGYNNYGTPGYPVSGGYQGGNNFNTVPQSQIPNTGYAQVQLPYSGIASPVYQYPIPVTSYAKPNPQVANTYYAPYTRALFTRSSSKIDT